MGPKLLTAFLAATACALVAWVVQHQLANRREVEQGIQTLRGELLRNLPEGPERIRAESTVTRYVEQALGFERTVSRSELFLTRQLLALAATDTLIAPAEVAAILDTMEQQMSDASSTVLRSAAGQTQ